VEARTPSAAAPAAVRRTAAVLGLAGLALLAGLVVAGPAAAIDDLARPDARVTHGPSCRPGGIVVEVVAGTAAAAVTLATTRTPAGEDSAELQPGETAVLRSADVAWGETIDGRLEYRALDGSGDTWVDELEAFSFTRPAEEDCAAITAPAAPATVPGLPPADDARPTGTAADAPGSAGPAGAGAPDAPDAADSSAPPRVIEPGVPAATPAPDAGAGAGTDALEVPATAVAPAAAVREASVAPVFLAAVALGAAAAGLGSALGLPGRRRRRPTPGA
jgi:hypothetical protein